MKKNIIGFKFFNKIIIIVAVILSFKKVKMSVTGLFVVTWQLYLTEVR